MRSKTAILDAYARLLGQAAVMQQKDPGTAGLAVAMPAVIETLIDIRDVLSEIAATLDCSGNIN